MTPTRIMATGRDSARTAPKLAGSWLTTEAKISSDMPLPMPRWVMSSPIHMMRAVPAVRLITTISTRLQL